MDQHSFSSSSSHPPHLPLFLDSLPSFSPSSLLPFHPSPPLLPPPPPPNPKKRSRASRRAPTTVLTTDTSNFRAMVQQFTGIPSPPFSSSSSSSRFLINPSSHKHQTTTTPYTLPFPPLSSTTSNTFLHSLTNTQLPLLAATKPPYPSPPPFAMAAHDELLDSWVCSSAYK